MNPKEIIEVLEQNNKTLGILACHPVDDQLLEKQVELNNKLIEQLENEIGIDKINA